MPTTIYTETSRYILDRANKTITRHPGEGQRIIKHLGGVATSTLRKDAETIKLHSMVTCEVGKPMEMLIDVREDGIATYRKTTTVRSIVDNN